MARKVFISVLGTGFYGKCRYSVNGILSSPTRFIQFATLELLQKDESKRLTSDDVALILLTDKAKTQNWDKAITHRSKFKGGEEEEYLGLESELKKLDVNVETLSIKNGMSESEMWDIFKTIFDYLKDEDELYFDLTHGFRYLPMLILVLGNYSKFLKKTKVSAITYGNFEAKEGDIAPIVDLMPLTTIQDWTFACANYLKNGYVEDLKNVSQKPLSTLLKETETRDFAKPLKNFVKSLESLASERQTCRGLDISNANSYKSLVENAEQIIQGTGDSGISLLMPVIDKVYGQLKGEDNSTLIARIFSAVKWCIDNSLYQQAVTILQEGIVSYFADRHGIPLDDKGNRDLVNNAMSIKFYKTQDAEDLWEVENEEQKKIIREILKDEFLANDCLPSMFNSLSNLRNDYNHCGYRDTSSSADRIKKKICNLYEQAQVIFSYCQSDIHEVPRERVFLNISNHPLEQWPEKQLKEAEKYGRVVDYLFPSIEPAMSTEDIEVHALDVCNDIISKYPDSDLTIHIMGEMTFTFALVNLLKSHGIKCLASTTNRLANSNSDGSKISWFDFAGFREYV